MNDGAERIIRRILDDARAKAEAMQAEAAKKIAAMEVEAKKTAAAKKEQVLAQARKEAEEQKRRILGVAQLDARKELLAAKQELIEEAFQRSLQVLFDMEDGAYLAVLREMLLAVVETGTETVLLSARDQGRIPAGFWPEINAALAKRGKAGKLAPGSDTRDIRGGFILQSGGVEINCSFASLLEMQRDELEPEVAALLFN
jgi:V/A-type H+-transporting ATPase subunit E